jgi:hypothetical protein
MAHGDYTGNTKAELARKFAQQQQFAAQNMSLVSQVVSDGRSQVVDLTTDADREMVANTRISTEGDDVQEVDVNDPSLEPVKFQASETVEQVTVGKDRQFNLEAGQVYQAPRWVVEHLDEKDLVRH